MRVVTWNVNSLRARMPRVEELLTEHAPDVVLLQETKVAPDAFPEDELAALGYRSAHASGGQWAGVAILARDHLTLEDVQPQLPGSPVPGEARWVEATVDGIRFASVYVVNGRSVEHELYFVKLDFLSAMAERAAALTRAGDPAAAGPDAPQVVIAGDMNVCPTDVDVYSTTAMAGSTHVSPAERAAWRRLLDDGGLTDAHIRRWGEDAEQFTWWDYRAGSFHKNLGLRIDMHLVSASLADRIAHVGILRDLRKGSKPSDHAPLELELTR